MIVIESPKEMQSLVNAMRLDGKKIGFVPTMGALHEGHLSLVALAQKKSDVVIMSIFVNPLQFGQHEDFGKYPRPFEEDKLKATSKKVDFLFMPTADALYGEGFQTYVALDQISTDFEGKIRPHHFRGVATVVLKLLNITKPHVAVFGQKDAQQLSLIMRMVEDLNMEVEIVGAPIIREKDGLALSSRNQFLSKDERSQAVILSQALIEAKKRLDFGERDCETIKLIVKNILSSMPLISIDYVEFVSASTFSIAHELLPNKAHYLIIAVKIGNVRLLDNLYFSL